MPLHEIKPGQTARKNKRGAVMKSPFKKLEAKTTQHHFRQEGQGNTRTCKKN